MWDIERAEDLENEGFDEPEPEEVKLLLAEFISACQHDVFTDDDGVGMYATVEECSTHRVYPSETVAPGWAPPEGFTHIVWVNK